MSLTSHTCLELKSLNYGAITIEFMNYVPSKFNGDILFELLPIHHPLGKSKKLQGMDRKFDGHVWCKLQTSNIKNSFRLGFQNDKMPWTFVLLEQFFPFVSMFFCVE